MPFLFPAFPISFSHLLGDYWKKLTCGVVRVFMFLRNGSAVAQPFLGHRRHIVAISIISTISPSAPSASSASSASSDLLSTARPIPHTLLFHHTFILLCLPSRASFRPLPLGLNASDLQLATLFARGHVAAVAACIRSGACFQSHCELTIAVPTPELRLTQVDSG